MDDRWKMAVTGVLSLVLVIGGVALGAYLQRRDADAAQVSRVEACVAAGSTWTHDQHGNWGCW